MRGAAFAAAADLSAGVFWLDDASAPVPAAAAAAAAALARAAVPVHLAVPPGAEPLVEAQARIVERRFAGVRRRTRHYFPMIERTLGRRGLPDDLKYVAVIESALNPEAESHAGAAGLWQFMPETAADFGLDSLTVRDPARATDAAARFLGRLHRMFRGDWQLALAAYNSGPGRVSRIVRAFETETGRYPTFWDIHAELPRETQDYVPRFIAVARWFEPPRAL
jgi:membrane-bound lytic murein transglycosylase D